MKSNYIEGTLADDFLFCLSRLPLFKSECSGFSNFLISPGYIWFLPGSLGIFPYTHSKFSQKVFTLTVATFRKKVRNAPMPTANGIAAKPTLVKIRIVNKAVDPIKLIQSKAVIVLDSNSKFLSLLKSFATFSPRNLSIRENLFMNLLKPLTSINFYIVCLITSLTG